MKSSRDIGQMRRCLELDRPESQQRELLLSNIVLPNLSCEYGRQHDFDRIRDVGDFQRVVPLCSYEDLRPYIDRMMHNEQGLLVSEPVRRFFITSGSTAAPKHIPVTSSFIREKWRAFQLYWNTVRQHHPGIVGGSVITNFSDGSHESATAGGLPCGSESSFWNSWGRGPTSVLGTRIPHQIGRISDAGARYYCLARVLLEQEPSVLMALNPSTIVVLCDIINERCDALIEDIRVGGLSPHVRVEPEVRTLIEKNWTGNPARACELRDLARRATSLPLPGIWRTLGVVICWRSPMLRPYIELLTPHLGRIPQRDYILMASEGVVAIPFEDCYSGGILAVNTHFYEFIPEEDAEDSNAATVLAHQLEIGRHYVVVLSNSAGLYRYKLGDVVNVKEFIGSTPVLEFLHRAGNTCSLTGEKLTEDQVADAVSNAAFGQYAELKGFTLCPAPAPFPHYNLIVELSNTLSPEALRQLLAAFDQHLCQINIEYKAKRESRRLGPPELLVARTGSYAELRQRRSAMRTSDAQMKLACLTRDAGFRDNFPLLEHVSCTSSDHASETTLGSRCESAA